MTAVMADHAATIGTTEPALPWAWSCPAMPLTLVHFSGVICHQHRSPQSKATLQTSVQHGDTSARLCTGVVQPKQHRVLCGLIQLQNFILPQLYYCWYMSQLRYLHTALLSPVQTVSVSGILHMSWASCRYFSSESTVWLCLCYVQVRCGCFHLSKFLSSVLTHKPYTGRGAKKKKTALCSAGH